MSPHLVAPHAVAVEEAHLLVFLPAHVVHTLVGLHVPDLRGDGSGQVAWGQTDGPMCDLCVTFHLLWWTVCSMVHLKSITVETFMCLQGYSRSTVYTVILAFITRRARY